MALVFIRLRVKCKAFLVCEKLKRTSYYFLTFLSMLGVTRFSWLQVLRENKPRFRMGSSLEHTVRPVREKRRARLQVRQGAAYDMPGVHRSPHIL